MKTTWALVGLAAALAGAGCARNETTVPAEAGEGRVVDGSTLFEVKETKFESGSKTPFTGAVVRRYPSGQKKAEIRYRDGVPDGMQTSWYENGQMKSEHGYRYGVPVGTWRSWYENGQLAEEIENRDGVEVSRQDWDENGNPIRR